MYPIPIGSAAEIAVDAEGVVVLEIPDLEGCEDIGLELENTGNNALTACVVKAREGPDLDYENDLGEADWDAAATHPRIHTMTVTPHDLAASAKTKLRIRMDAAWGMQLVLTSAAGTTVKVAGNRS